MKLEIGPGPHGKIDDSWVTIDAVKGNADYLCRWGTDRLPFGDETIEEIYASHVIEHLMWLDVKSALQDCYRVLKLGGQIEIHTIDFDKICQRTRLDKWAGRHFVEPDDHDMLWVNARLFCAAFDGDQFNQHRSCYTFSFLKWLLGYAGFIDVRYGGPLRGKVNHGIIDLSVKSRKPS